MGSLSRLHLRAWWNCVKHSGNVPVQRDWNVTYARLFLTGIRVACLFPRENHFHARYSWEREGAREREKKRDELPRVHESQMAFAPGYSVYVRKYRGFPMINLFSSGKRARPLEQCYWPICRATRGINCCFRYRLLVALTPTAWYALFSDGRTLFHDVNVSFALFYTFIAYTRIFKRYNCPATRMDTSAFPVESSITPRLGIIWLCSKFLCTLFLY